MGSEGAKLHIILPGHHVTGLFIETELLVLCVETFCFMINLFYDQHCSVLRYNHLNLLILSHLSISISPALYRVNQWPDTSGETKLIKNKSQLVTCYSPALSPASPHLPSTLPSPRLHLHQHTYQPPLA